MSGEQTGIMQNLLSELTELLFREDFLANFLENRYSKIIRGGLPMTTKERKQYNKELKDMKEFAKEVSSSKEKSVKFLQQAGILTSSGKLSKFYR